MAVCIPATHTAHTLSTCDTAAAAARLRWTYRRADKSVLCELALDPDESAYELKTTVPWSVDVLVERFADAIAALQRQTAVERLLVQEGWSLESFRRVV
jgi:hypothetical protein